MNLHCASLFWLIVVFAAHCRGGAADDKKWCGMAEDNYAYFWHPDFWFFF